MPIHHSNHDLQEPGNTGTRYITNGNAFVIWTLCSRFLKVLPPHDDALSLTESNGDNAPDYYSLIYSCTPYDRPIP